MTIVNIMGEDKEIRHCFKQEPHSMHVWHEDYWCSGAGLDEGMKVNEILGRELTPKFCLEDDPHLPHVHKYKDFLYWCSGEGWDAIERSVPPKETVHEIDKANELLASRREVYGDRVQNMVRIAQMWSGFLGFEIQPWQVPIMELLNKIYRVGVTPNYSDNVDDVEGWLKIFREVIGDDMILARTVEEYLNKKMDRKS